jgi:hypothetical protein
MDMKQKNIYLINYLIKKINKKNVLFVIFSVFSFVGMIQGQDCSTLNGGKVTYNGVTTDTVCYNYPFGTYNNELEASQPPSGGSPPYVTKWRGTYVTGIYSTTTSDFDWEYIGGIGLYLRGDTVKICLEVTDSKGCIAYSDTIVFVSHPRVEMNNITSQEVCSGETVSATNFSTPLTLNIPAVTYSWEADNNYYLVGLSNNSGTGDIASFKSNPNTTNAPIITEITVTPKIKDCIATNANKKKFTIAVNPEPEVNTINGQTVCNDVKIDDITIDGIATRYEWKVTSGDYSVLGLTAPNGTLSNSPYKITFSGNTNNTGNSPADVTIEVTPYYTDCPGIAKEFTVTVEPEVKVEITTTTGASVCEGADYKLDYTSSAAVNALWTSSNTAIANVNAGIVTGLSAGTTTITCTVTTDGGCTDSDSYDIIVLPKPDAGTITGEAEVCVGSKIMLGNLGASSGDGISTEWKSSDESKATVDANTGEVTGISAGEVNILYNVTNSFGCSNSTYKTLTVKSGDLYSDIRLRLCPSVSAVNLSKYTDAVGMPISWSGPFIETNGDLNVSKLSPPGTYTFVYTVTTCSSQSKTNKAYVKILRSNEIPHIQNRVSICYNRAQSVNINQLFGIESGGTLTYDNAAVGPYITITTDGATILNGTALYGSSYPNEVNVEFTYTSGGNCFDGKVYKLTLVLTPDIVIN